MEPATHPQTVKNQHMGKPFANRKIATFAPHLPCTLFGPRKEPEKRGRDSSRPPKSTIPWCLHIGTTDRSISDHRHVTGGHGREARGADPQGCCHHGFTSFGWFVPG